MIHKVASRLVGLSSSTLKSVFKNDLCRLIGITMISIPTLVNDYIKVDDLSKQYELLCENLDNIFV